MDFFTRVALQREMRKKYETLCYDLYTFLPSYEKMFKGQFTSCCICIKHTRGKNSSSRTSSKLHSQHTTLLLHTTADLRLLNF